MPVTAAEGARRLSRELDMLRAGNVVFSTNVHLRLDGKARSEIPSDPGVASYFTIGGKQTVLACDRWDTVGANFAALAKHVDAMRGMARWGVGSIEQALTAYALLPAPVSWRELLEDPRTLAEAERAFRDLIRKAHPDFGGTTAAAAALTEAIATARKELR